MSRRRRSSRHCQMKLGGKCTARSSWRSFGQMANPSARAINSDWEENEMCAPRQVSTLETYSEFQMNISSKTGDRRQETEETKSVLYAGVVALLSPVSCLLSSVFPWVSLI